MRPLVFYVIKNPFRRQSKGRKGSKRFDGGRYAAPDSRSSGQV